MMADSMRPFAQSRSLRCRRGATCPSLCNCRPCTSARAARPARPAVAPRRLTAVGDSGRAPRSAARPTLQPAPPRRRPTLITAAGVEADELETIAAATGVADGALSCAASTRAGAYADPGSPTVARSRARRGQARSPARRSSSRSPTAVSTTGPPTRPATRARPSGRCRFRIPALFEGSRRRQTSRPPPSCASSRRRRPRAPPPSSAP